MATSGFFEMAEIPSPQPTPIRRPPSYSDSYYVLGGHHSAPILEPLVAQPQKVSDPPQIPVTPRIHLFAIKVAIHLFLISVFETLFFFRYVSVTENNGILKTIDTYYTPFIDTCPAWSNDTRAFLYALLTQGNSYELIQANAAVAASQRISANQTLLEESLVASGVCLMLVIAEVIYCLKQQIPVRWWVIAIENTTMVMILGIYEYVFFRYVIYNYGTLSTPELNAHLVDGIYNCVTASTDG
jgi:hypothetical protein